MIYGRSARRGVAFTRLVESDRTGLEHTVRRPLPPLGRALAYTVHGDREVLGDVLMVFEILVSDESPRSRNVTKRLLSPTVCS